MGLWSYVQKTTRDVKLNCPSPAREGDTRGGVHLCAMLVVVGRGDGDGMGMGWGWCLENVRLPRWMEDGEI
jgi:hypothetical protein